MYCHSARSDRQMVCLAPLSSTKVYVGSGGKKANLAAIFDGHGGQQKRQHNSRTPSPFMARPSFSSLLLNDNFGNQNSIGTHDPMKDIVTKVFINIGRGWSATTTIDWSVSWFTLQWTCTKYYTDIVHPASQRPWHISFACSGCSTGS